MDISINIDGISLNGILDIPKNAKGIIIFAHGSGSGRLSPRNQFVAQKLQEVGFATLLFDLLTLEEEEIDEIDAHLRFDIPFLADRLQKVASWVASNADTKNLKIGYFGASTGAAAALVAASKAKELIKAVVSRGGRPDLAYQALKSVKAPTLLIVGSNDQIVLSLNEEALEKLSCEEKKLEIVKRASHLFPEPGTLDEVCKLATMWFKKYLNL